MPDTGVLAVITVVLPIVRIVVVVRPERLVIQNVIALGAITYVPTVFKHSFGSIPKVEPFEPSSDFLHG